jgi:hypothetical protein
MAKSPHTRLFKPWEYGHGTFVRNGDRVIRFTVWSGTAPYGLRPIILVSRIGWLRPTPRVYLAWFAPLRMTLKPRSVYVYTLLHSPVSPG